MYRQNQQTSSRSGGQDVNIRPPKPPERPLVPYMRFSRKMWPKVRNENPDSPLWDIGKMIGQLWRDALDNEKAVYQLDYEAEKVEYEKAMKAYHNSPAYQQYLSARNRSKIVQANEKSVGGRKGAQDASNVTGVIIQPVDDEDPYELTGKRLSAIRFDRNNRLMSELFAPNYLPDTRSLVPQQRIDQLRKQGQSLASHQQKLNDELKRLEDNFNQRKRAVESTSEVFNANLKKVCEEKPQALTEANYNNLVAEWETTILKNYEEFKKQQQVIRARQEAERLETPVLYSLTCGNPSPGDTGPGFQRPSVAEQNNEMPPINTHEQMHVDTKNSEKMETDESQLNEEMKADNTENNGA
ncbi:HMG (high mobility group) box domain-containing protein [Ditylenchus destructor]|nr:HMG (high mobility group) box domain-containing protein [Ditylenchus destructor]